MKFLLFEKPFIKRDPRKDLIHICSYCKKIRDDKNDWQNVETFLAKNLKVMCAHTICPDCMKEHYPDLHSSKVE